MINLAKANLYKTKDGRKALIYNELPTFLNHFRYVGVIHESTPSSIRGGTACCWSPEGYSREAGKGTHANDIVGPWEEEKKAPKVDWSKFPAHFRYLAMDDDGDWYGYYQRPILLNDKFIAPDETAYDTHFEIYGLDEPDFEGDWKDSLCVRPGVPVAHVACGDEEDEDE